MTNSLQERLHDYFVEQTAHLPTSAPEHDDVATVDLALSSADSGRRGPQTWMMAAAVLLPTVLLAGLLLAGRSSGPRQASDGGDDGAPTTTIAEPPSPPHETRRLGDLVLSDGVVIAVGVTVDGRTGCMYEDGIESTCVDLPADVDEPFVWWMGEDSAGRQVVWGVVPDGLNPVLVNPDGTQERFALTEPDQEGRRAFAMSRESAARATVRYLDHDEQIVASEQIGY